MPCEDKMKERFEKLAGEDGKLSFKELRCLVKELMKEEGLKLKDLKEEGQKPREMLKEWDTDGDKMFTWDEFKAGPMKRLQEVMKCSK